MKLSKRVSSLSPSATMAISARAKELKKEGKDVISFGLGEPDFATADYIIDATIEALKAGKTKYCPASGTPELKEAVLSYYKRKYNLEYNTNEVIINVGAKHSLYNIFQAMVAEGDEVILPAPYWVSYIAHIKLAEATPVIIETSDENNFKINVSHLEKSVTDKTKAVILNSPSNPSGAVYHEDELKEIGEYCAEKGIYIVYDEVYDNFVYNHEHVCLATLSEKIKEYTILVNAVSKSYAMTGYRIGYILADKELINAINKIQSHSTSNPVTFAMEGAISALSGGDEKIVEMANQFKKRRNIFVSGMNEIEGISCNMPEGAFYIFPNIEKLFGKKINGKVYSTDEEFCKALLEEKLIACVPGSAFGSPGHLRFSYAASLSDIERALKRLKEWL